MQSLSGRMEMGGKNEIIIRQQPACYVVSSLGHKLRNMLDELGVVPRRPAVGDGDAREFGEAACGHRARRAQWKHQLTVGRWAVKPSLLGEWDELMRWRSPVEAMLGLVTSCKLRRQRST